MKKFVIMMVLMITVGMNAVACKHDNNMLKLIGSGRAAIDYDRGIVYIEKTLWNTLSWSEKKEVTRNFYEFSESHKLSPRFTKVAGMYDNKRYSQYKSHTSVEVYM